MQTKVASANILYKLGNRDAVVALEQVLAEEPDLVGLQEWYISRLPLLRRTGDVRTVPALLGLSVPGPDRYHWVSSVSCGNVVGARADRFDLIRADDVLLSGIGRSDRPDRFLSTEPPRLVTIGLYADRAVDRTVAIMSYHLCPGVEEHGRYIADRPLLIARHRQEVKRLEQLIARYQRDGHVVYAVGDSNFDSQRLAGLTSSWVGREDAPGTIGSRTRKLDDVHGPGPATEVKLLSTPSDHRALISVRGD
ncbi:hypothetical protein [Nocardioides marmorisolisilvae]|uniref:Endonuclease/exonuclease/phosphatase family protein n=1 Tax=Nocardioides marmorisolisilvae TaxID=1542737 RepID=A0A3N0DWQ2_9ACTN|nr:hypothetical protein [Nocardioides marmorisolisilvae]RNL80044.1 hypothetical protein EFL95_14090 [Nocardioides marmorisolisilvae]